MRRRTLTTALAAALTGTAAAGALAGCSDDGNNGGGGGAGTDPSDGGSGDGGAEAPKALIDGIGMYPRAIRLAHAADTDANDRLLASVVSFDGPEAFGAIVESTDGGSTFSQVGTVSDKATTGGEGLCCATLYELPRAVGDLAEGTLLWSASVGADKDDPRMSIRVWASTDVGRTWKRIAITHTAKNAGGLWKPEFATTDDGTLVVLFCDETDGDRHSQKIVSQTSEDGETWTDPEPVLELDDPEARPGMPNVRRLEDDRWAMSYEVCGPKDLCRTYVRTADDPRDWGSVTARDEIIRASDGTEPRHTPTLAVDEDGSLVLGSQMHYMEDESLSEDNGKLALRTTNTTLEGDVAWETEPAPVPVQDPDDSPCPNYSPTYVRTEDGKLLEITTAPDDSDTCTAQFGLRG
jgi:hypothetical protein